MKNYKNIGCILMLLYAAECTFGGSGRWAAFAGISIRIALFAICFLVSLPAVVAGKTRYIRKPIVLAAILFGILVGISAVIGIRNGNSLSFVKADVTSFMALALLPGTFAIFSTEDRLEKLLSVIFWSAVFTAVVTTGMHFSLRWMDGNTINLLNNWINLKSLGGLALLQTGIHRVYFKAQIFLPFSICIGVWKMMNCRRGIRWLYIFADVLQLFAVVLSYTRGLWIGLAGSCLAAAVLLWKEWKRLLPAAGAILLGLLLMFGLSWADYGAPYCMAEIVNRFDPNLIVLTVNDAEEEKFTKTSSSENCTNESHEAEGETEKQGETVVEVFPDSDNEEIAEYVNEANEAAVSRRQESLKELKRRIVEHPLLGWGLGTNLDGIREDGKTEYMYLDILMKMGFAGLIGFCLVFFCDCFRFAGSLFSYRRYGCQGKRLGYVRSSLLAAGYLSVAVTSIFNPYLTTPMGILMLSVMSLSVHLYLQGRS